MATTQHMLLSPSELAYLHSSLSLTPPIRPDGRTPTQFRPLMAETNILPGTHGSARVCFADGTEAIVGVKAEVERTALSPFATGRGDGGHDDDAESRAGASGVAAAAAVDELTGDKDWVEMAVEIPGCRDDDSSTVFIATMLSEALLADGLFTKKLAIHRRFHWKLYIDIMLISPPLSYPLPLLSLTTHLALLATRLPRLKSEKDEDPMFDDDWEASSFLYPRRGRSSATDNKPTSRPPITLLVMAVGDNIIFDPSKEELAVADCALAVSVSETPTEEDTSGDAMDVDAGGNGRSLRLLSVRTIDPPSRLTPPGVPKSTHAAGQGPAFTKNPEALIAETESAEGVWRAPRGGVKHGVLTTMVRKALGRGGVAYEVLDCLEGVEVG